MKYNEVLEHLKQNLGYTTRLLFDISSSAGKEEYERFFNYYQSNIERHYEYGFSNGYFYFIDSSEIDARARKTKSNYLIGISKEIIERFGRLFHTYFNIEEIPELKDYNNIQQKISNPIGELMYQFILHFTFYHELGHLIQFINSSDIEREESPNKQSNFNIKDHDDELDADMFSSICLSSHISQYFEDYFRGAPTLKDYTQFLSLTVGTIYVYFLTFTEYKTALYFKENSHPHPIVRTLGAIGILMDSFKHILNKRKSPIVIRQEILIPEALRIAELFIKKFHGDFEFEELKEKMKDKFNEINEYYEELQKNILSNPHSAINRRNEVIREKRKHSI